MGISGENGFSAASRGLRIKMKSQLMSDKTPGNNDMEKCCSMLVRRYFFDKTGSVADASAQTGRRSTRIFSLEFVAPGTPATCIACLDFERFDACVAVNQVNCPEPRLSLRTQRSITDDPQTKG